MGLVRVYMGQEEWQQANTLCKKIGTSSQPSLQQWSQKTLNKITQRMSAANAKTVTNSGFQPISEERSQPSKKATSGFQPIATSNKPPAHRTSSSRTTVTAAPESSQRSVPSAVNSADSVASATSVLEKSAAPVEPSAKRSHPKVERESPPDGVSMFHYAYLNGEDADTSTEPQDAAHSDVATAATDFEWPYANRLEKGRVLGKIKRGQLWFMQISGAIASYVLFRTLIHSAAAIINRYLRFLDRILPFNVSFLPNWLSDATWPLLAVMAVVLVTSPWTWDWWLHFTANRRKFSVSSLRSHSAEAATLLNRYCRQRKWSLPTLHKLPTDIPLIFSYGFLPRNARLVISEGLLNLLNDDELAVLVAYEMSHWKSWHWPLLSAQMLISQVLLHAHWQLAMWGNRQATAIKWTAGAIATLLYSIFWLARLPSAGMARVRTYYGDRKSTELTGNPNGLARALSKLSFGLAASTEQQGYTPILIEGVLPLLPAATDLSRQQVYGQMPLAQLFAWDSQNPLRAWMSTFNNHPPLGDRLRLVMAYAGHWKLTPEIALSAPPRRQKSMSMQNWRQLWMHATPYVGVATGISVGLLLLGVGAIANEFEWLALDWMHKDTGLFHFCWLLGISVGNIMRINRFFPDLSFAMAPSDNFANWIGDSELLPASSMPTKLSGQLVGRPGIANWLGQDLMLRTGSGLVRLHFFSLLGPLGNVLNRQKTPRLLTGRTVQVLGWFRRSNQTWLDVDKIRLGNGSLVEAAHPLHSLLIAVIALAAGLWLLIKNSPYG